MKSVMLDFNQSCLGMFYLPALRLCYGLMPRRGSLAAALPVLQYGWSSSSGSGHSGSGGSASSPASISASVNSWSQPLVPQYGSSHVVPPYSVSHVTIVFLPHLPHVT